MPEKESSHKGKGVRRTDFESEGKREKEMAHILPKWSLTLTDKHEDQCSAEREQRKKKMEVFESPFHQRKGKSKTLGWGTLAD